MWCETYLQFGNLINNSKLFKYKSSEQERQCIKWTQIQSAKDERQNEQLRQSSVERELREDHSEVEMVRCCVTL
jgi:hypothetical protein